MTEAYLTENGRCEIGEKLVELVVEAKMSVVAKLDKGCSDIGLRSRSDIDHRAVGHYSLLIQIGQPEAAVVHYRVAQTDYNHTSRAVGVLKDSGEQRVERSRYLTDRHTTVGRLPRTRREDDGYHKGQ